jgi:hypothetical protein
MQYSRIYRFFNASLYGLIKTFRKNLTVSEEILLGINEAEVNKLDERLLASYINLLSFSYKPSPEFNQTFKKLETGLPKKLKGSHDIFFYRVIHSYYEAYKKSYHNVSPDLLQEFIARSDTYQRNDKIFVMSIVLKLIKLYKSKNIEYEKVYLNFLKDYNVEVLSSLSHKEILAVLYIVFSLRTANNDILIVDNAGSSVIDNLREVLSQITESLNPTDLANTLKLYIKFNSTPEEFLRNLETKVFAKLSSIKDKDLSKLLVSYDKRIVHDYFYMVNNIYKPFYEELIDRFDKFDFFYLQDFIFHYYIQSHYYGMYCDARILDKSLELVRNTEKIPGKIKIKLLSTILYICKESGFINSELVEGIYNSIKPNLDSLDYSSLLRYANAFSIQPERLQEFWEYFRTKINDIMGNSESKKTYLYAIYLNLSLQSPEIYEIIKPELSNHLETLKKIWNLKRKNDIVNKNPSQMHKNVENALKSLKIEYITEYYEDYYIDIAIPSQKVAIEIMGPGHYIFPSKRLNNKTENKSVNLKLKGWFYLALPFFLQNLSINSIENHLKSSLPLQY